MFTASTCTVPLHYEASCACQRLKNALNKSCSPESFRRAHLPYPAAPCTLPSATMGAPSDQDSAEAQFQAFLQAMQQGSDMPAELRDQLVTAMQKKWNAPPVQDLEAVLHRAVPMHKARQLLFYPDTEDMRLYPALLASPPPGSPDTHPQAKMQALGLSVFYLVHSYSWDKLKPFIEAGGLLRLVSLVSHSNLYLASQAMQCLLRATDEEIFPWHDPPLPSDGRSVKDGPDGLVWRRMFELSRTTLIPDLLKHQNPDTFPGSGLLVLRLFAFLASWLRYHFTEDRVLRLGANLLSLLNEWSTRDSVTVEEKQLAKALYDDFSRFPPASAPVNGPRLGSGANTTDESTVLCDTMGSDMSDDMGVTVVTDHTQVNHTEPSESERLREVGNEAYRQGDWAKAINAYSAALDVPVPAADLPTEGPRRARLLCNRAATYLARAATGGGIQGESDESGLLEGIELGSSTSLTRHYEAALLDCDAALDLDPAHVKATYRKAQALYWLGRYPDALRAAQRAVSLITTHTTASDSHTHTNHTASHPRAMLPEVQSLIEDIQQCMTSTTNTKGGHSGGATAATDTAVTDSDTAGSRGAGGGSFHADVAAAAAQATSNGRTKHGRSSTAQQHAVQASGASTGIEALVSVMGAASMSEKDKTNVGEGVGRKGGAAQSVQGSVGGPQGSQPHGHHTTGHKAAGKLVQVVSESQSSLGSSDSSVGGGGKGIGVVRNDVMQVYDCDEMD